jgi:hypothetical protein
LLGAAQSEIKKEGSSKRTRKIYPQTAGEFDFNGRGI